MLFYPHAHCLVPGGGVCHDGTPRAATRRVATRAGPNEMVQVAVLPRQAARPQVLHRPSHQPGSALK
ncbi:MAG: hypothetical protein DMG42_15385 [Acidobacteria bacterium]|nr:MAG: hypothetical protein DMG42_15385 [Acidobacteriota bacterium]